MHQQWQRKIRRLKYFLSVNTWLGSKVKNRASLVAQWLRICLSMQGTWVRALVWKDPTCNGATKPVSHNYWACMPQLLSPHATTTEAHAPRACAPQQEKPPQGEARAPGRSRRREWEAAVVPVGLLQGWPASCKADRGEARKGAHEAERQAGGQSLFNEKCHRLKNQTWG